MKNKLKNKKIAIVIAILAILIIGIGIFLATNKNDDVVSESGTEEEIKYIYYQPDGEELTEDHLQEIKDYMNSYNEMIIQYSIFEDFYDKDEMYLERKYYTEVASKIDVKNKVEETYNSHLLYDENGNMNSEDEAFQKVRTTLEKEIGFDYSQYDNIYDISCAVSKLQFADPDKFVGARVDDNMQKLTYEHDGQSYYFYKNDNKDLIASIGEYDEILEISSDITIQDEEIGESISYIRTKIKFKKDDKIIERSMTTSIWLWDSALEVYDEE